MRNIKSKRKKIVEKLTLCISISYLKLQALNAFSSNRFKIQPFSPTTIYLPGQSKLIDHLQRLTRKRHREMGVVQKTELVKQYPFVHGVSHTKYQLTVVFS